jgi:hypothetical protein
MVFCFYILFFLAKIRKILLPLPNKSSIMQSKHNNTMNKMRKVLFAGLSFLAPMMAVANPVDDLLNRMDAGAARKFVTVLQPSDTDFFELSQQGAQGLCQG